MVVLGLALAVPLQLLQQLHKLPPRPPREHASRRKRLVATRVAHGHDAHLPHATRHTPQASAPARHTLKRVPCAGRVGPAAGVGQGVGQRVGQRVGGAVPCRLDDSEAVGRLGSGWTTRKGPRGVVRRPSRDTRMAGIVRGKSFRKAARHATDATNATDATDAIDAIDAIDATDATHAIHAIHAISATNAKARQVR